MASETRKRQQKGPGEAAPAPASPALPATAPRPQQGCPEPLTFVLTQEQGGCQPSIHDGLLIQDGGGGGRELGVAQNDGGGKRATRALLTLQPNSHPPLDCGPLYAPGPA